MDKQLIERKFGRMGARVRVSEASRVNRVAIDIKRDRRGEYFDLQLAGGAGVWVDAIDVRPRERHLLLMAADDDRGSPAGIKQKFLCGHDERSWFVAAVPEGRRASNVREAFEALKPAAVLQRQTQAHVRTRDRNRRRNAAFVRQGEWFFLPRPDAIVKDAEVLRDEIITRGRGKPHRCQFLVRRGGELVYLNGAGEVLDEADYWRLARHSPKAAAGYSAQRRDMDVLVKGRVTHPDHRTIVLPFWHSVVMNTENQSRAMHFVRFID